MRVLATGGPIPQVDESVQGEKCGAGQGRGSGFRAGGEPAEGRTSDQVSRPDIAHKMWVEGTGLRRTRNSRVPRGRGSEHQKRVQRQAEAEND